jgi:hypothetical protein
MTELYGKAQAAWEEYDHISSFVTHASKRGQATKEMFARIERARHHAQEVQWEYEQRLNAYQSQISNAQR